MASELGLFGGDAPRGGDCGSGREPGSPPNLLLERCCTKHAPILFERGGEVKTNRTTGREYIAMPPRRRPEISLRYSVPGLKAFRYDGETRFEWISAECIDEAEARDAQNRAGWNDYAYGFGDLEIGILQDGTHRAKWSCGESRE